MKVLTSLLIVTFLGMSLPATSLAQQETDDFGFPIDSGSAVAAPRTGTQRSRSTTQRRQRPGKGFWANQRASRSLRHARDYSRDIYRYSRQAEIISPQVARAEVQNLGRNINLAKKEIAVVRNGFEGNKEVISALAAIDKHIAKAAETHKKLHEECAKDAPDGHMCASCCSDITKELDKALAEHAALIRKLEGKPAPVAKEK